MVSFISEAAVPEREEKEEKPDEDEDKASFAVKSTTKAVVPTRWESKVRELGLSNSTTDGPACIGVRRASCA